MAVALVLACGSPTGLLTVTVDPGSVVMGIGDTLTFTVTVRDEGGRRIAPSDISWSSSSPGVASVFPSGLVNGRTGGTTTITAEMRGSVGRSEVTVLPRTTGSWNGEIESTNRPGLFALLEETTGGVITGRVVIILSDISLSFIANGTHDHPNVTMEWNLAGFQPITYRGAFVGDDRIDGTVTGAGLTGEAANLIREKIP